MAAEGTAARLSLGQAAIEGAENAQREVDLDALIEGWGLDEDEAAEVVAMVELFLEKLRDGSISEKFFQLLLDKLADDKARDYLERHVQR